MPLELPDGWREQLPDNIRENGALDGIDSIDKMAEMIVNGRATLSNSVRIPSADASPEKMQEFIDDLQKKVPELVYVGEGVDMNNLYDRMGRPKEVGEYELGDIPDPLKGNFDGLVKVAHEHGVTKSAMQAMTKQILGDFEDSSAANAGALESAVEEVKKHYGEAFAERTNAAGEFAKQLGFDDTLVAAVKAGHVGLENMQAFNKVMEGFESPGPRIGDDQGSNDFQHLTPAQALEQRTEIFNNKQHPYWDAGSPGHKDAVDKVVELTRAVEAGNK